jgi:hypothetical protein
MNIYEQNQAFFSQPIRLSEDQKKEPVKVFTDFFGDHDLAEIRRRLAEWLECALTCDSDQYGEPNQRSNVLALAIRIEELLEAAFIIQSKKK